MLSIHPPKSFVYSWQLSHPDKRGNVTLFNAGSHEAKNVRVERDDSASVEPRTFHQHSIKASGQSDRFKVIRSGGQRIPTIRVIWQDPSGQGHSTRVEVKGI